MQPMQDSDFNSVVLNRIDARLEMLSRIIIGNGEVGMAEDVRTLKSKVTTLKSRVDDLERASAEAGIKFWTKIVLIVTAVGGLWEVAAGLLGG